MQAQKRSEPLTFLSFSHFPHTSPSLNRSDSTHNLSAGHATGNTITHASSHANTRIAQVTQHTQRACKRNRNEMHAARRHVTQHTHHASRITHHASRITHHASRIRHQASSITHHPSPITHHTSRITLHAASRSTHHARTQYASRITHHASRTSLAHNALYVTSWTCALLILSTQSTELVSLYIFPQLLFLFFFFLFFETHQRSSASSSYHPPPWTHIMGGNKKKQKVDLPTSDDAILATIHRMETTAQELRRLLVCFLSLLLLLSLMWRLFFNKGCQFVG